MCTNSNRNWLYIYTVSYIIYSFLPNEHRRFDIKWVAPKAEGSFSEARGDIMISHECITVNSSSAAFEIYSVVQTSYPDDSWINGDESNVKGAIPPTIEGVELDLRMRGFEFFSLVSYPFDSPRPTHLKATGKIKFQGKVLKPCGTSADQSCDTEEDNQTTKILDKQNSQSLVGEVSVSGLKLNQLMLAPQLAGPLSISCDHIKVMPSIFIFKPVISGTCTLLDL